MKYTAFNSRGEVVAEGGDRDEVVAIAKAKTTEALMLQCMMNENSGVLTYLNNEPDKEGKAMDWIDFSVQDKKRERRRMIVRTAVGTLAVTVMVIIILFFGLSIIK